MKLSARVQALTSSPIRKLTPYADAAKAAGKKVYHLNIGQPDIKTPDQFMNSIRQYEAPVIAYSNSKGEMFLLKAIQKYYAEKGMDYAIEDIFVTNGGSEALIMAVMALCDADDEIMVFETFYVYYTTVCKDFFESRECATDTGIVGDFAFFVQWYVEVNAHNRFFTCEFVVVNCHDN